MILDILLILWYFNPELWKKIPCLLILEIEKKFLVLNFL